MKKLNMFVIAIVTIFAGTIGAKALDVNVTTEEELKTCITTKSNVCKVTSDISLNTPIDININGEVTLDLNGHTIKASDAMAYSGGMFIVFHDSFLTVNDSVGTGKITTSTENDKVYAALQLTKKGENDDSKAAKIVVNGGHMIGYYYGLTGNGSNIVDNRRGNTEVVINGGKIEAIEGSGIYQPQIGTMTINGGEIKGVTGIEVRSGKLIVNDGVINGKTDRLNVVKNSNGTTADGMGLAIVQHTTKNPIDIEINGGTFKGYHGLFEMNVQGNEGIEEKLTMKISGGTFEGLGTGEEKSYAVTVDDCKNFITGGSFNKEIDKSYLANDTLKVISKNNYYVIEENKIIETTDKKISLESRDGLPTDFKLEIVKANKEETTIVEKNLTETYKDNKTARDVKLLALYDINILDGNNEVIPVEDGSFKVSIAINKEMQKYDTYKVVYIEDGKIKETLDAKLIDGKIVFNTTHFSEYALIGYNNVKEDNPKTLDNIVMFVCIAAAGVVLTVISSKKIASNM